MAQTATRSGARPAAGTVAPSPQIEVNLNRGGQAIINKAAEARQTRLDAEKVEDPLKAQRMALIIAACPDGELPPVGTKIIVRAMGVIRGVVRWQRNPPSVDLDLLLSAFPEAYDACVTPGDMRPQYDPA